jgi:hypothetical protein
MLLDVIRPSFRELGEPILARPFLQDYVNFVPHGHFKFSLTPVKLG